MELNATKMTDKTMLSVQEDKHEAKSDLISVHKRQIDEIKYLKQDRQRLLDVIRSLESNNKDLKSTVSGYEKTSQNKLQKELVKVGHSNTQLKLSVSELRLKGSYRDKEMHKMAQKLKDRDTHLQRLKADLQNCVGFIQEPKKLKESIKKIYARYVADGVKVQRELFKVEQSDVEGELQRAFCRQRDHIEKTVKGLKTRLARSGKQHDQAYDKIQKKNVGLTIIINELLKERLLQSDSQLLHRAESAVIEILDQ